MPALLGARSEPEREQMRAMGATHQNWWLRAMQQVVTSNHHSVGAEARPKDLQEVAAIRQERRDLQEVAAIRQERKETSMPTPNLDARSAAEHIKSLPAAHQEIARLRVEVDRHAGKAAQMEAQHAVLALQMQEHAEDDASYDDSPDRLRLEARHVALTESHGRLEEEVRQLHSKCAVLEHEQSGLLKQVADHATLRRELVDLRAQHAMLNDQHATLTGEVKQLCGGAELQPPMTNGGSPGVRSKGLALEPAEPQTVETKANSANVEQLIEEMRNLRLHPVLQDETMESELEVLRAEVERLRTEHALLHEEHRLLGSEAEQLRSRHKALEHEHGDLVAEARRAAEVSVYHKSAASVAQAELESLRNTGAKAHAPIDANHSAFTSLEEQLEERRLVVERMRDALHAEAEQSAVENEDLRAGLEAYDHRVKELQSLEDTLHEHRMLVDGHAAERESFQAELDRARAESDVIMGRLSELEQQDKEHRDRAQVHAEDHGALLEEVKRLRDEHTMLVEERHALGPSVRQRLEQAALQMDEHAALKARLEELETELAASAEAHRRSGHADEALALEDELERVCTQHALLVEKHGDLHEEAEGHRQQAEQHAAERAALLSELAQTRAAHDTLQQEHEALGHQHAVGHLQAAGLEALQAELDRTRMEHALMTDQHTALMDEVEDHRARSHEHSAERCRLQAEVERVRALGPDLQARVELADQRAAERDVLEAEIARLRAENAELRMRSDGLYFDGHQEKELLSAEAEGLQSQHRALEAERDELLLQLQDSRELANALVGERDHARDEHALLLVEHEGLLGEAERLRVEAAGLDAAGREAETQLEGLRRQTCQQAAAQAALEAEVARLTCQVESLMVDNNALRQQAYERDKVSTTSQLQDRPESYATATREIDIAPWPRITPPLPRAESIGTEPGDYAVVHSAIAAAEQWAKRTKMPPLSVAGVTYMGRVPVNFDGELGQALRRFAPIDADRRNIIGKAIEDGDLARRTLEIYKAHDRDDSGCLEWNNGEVRDFVATVFQEFGLSRPGEAEIYLVYRKFDQDSNMRLDAQECLCLADATLRASLGMSGGFVNASAKTSNELPVSLAAAPVRARTPASAGFVPQDALTNATQRQTPVPLGRLVRSPVENIHSAQDPSTARESTASAATAKLLGTQPELRALEARLTQQLREAERAAEGVLFASSATSGPALPRKRSATPLSAVPAASAASAGWSRPNSFTPSPAVAPPLGPRVWPSQGFSSEVAAPRSSSSTCSYASARAEPIASPVPSMVPPVSAEPPSPGAQHPSALSARLSPSMLDTRGPSTARAELARPPLSYSSRLTALAANATSPAATSIAYRGVHGSST